MLSKIREFINTHSKKQVLGIIAVLVILAVLPIAIIASQTQQETRQHAAEPSSPNPNDNNKQPAFAPGEILVKFKATAIELKVKSDVGVDLNKQPVSITDIEESVLPSILTTVNQQYKIKTIEKVFKQIESTAASTSKVGATDLSKIYKLSLDSNAPIKQIIEDLKKDPNIEYAEPNYILQTQAIPNDPYYPQMWNLQKIWIENAWDIAKGSNDVTVAVIDTGIDYTHPELGETKVDEREFQKITESPVSLLFPNAGYRASQTIAINKNRLVYYSNDKIYIYSFDTKTTQTIDLPSDGKTKKIIRLALKDNILVYAADYDRNNYYSKPQYYIYNLDTNEHKPIPYTSTTNVKPFVIGDGKVVYTSGSHVHIYDIQTGLVSTQTNENTYYFQYISYPKISGNLIAYSRHEAESGCYQAIVIHNIDTNERKRLYPPDIGPVLDFKDNKVLYPACSAHNIYYIYDIATDEYKKLEYNTDIPTSTNDVHSSAFAITVFSMIQEGAFGDDVLFLSEDKNGNGIVAFDQKNNRYIKIPILKAAYNFAAEDKRVCFLSNDSNIYCHIYDPNGSYPPPPENFFNSRVVNGYNFVENNNNPIDRYGHGTHVAGTIGAISNNNAGISGINWDIKLMAVKVLNDSGSGTTDNIVKGIVYASDNGAKIINMSLGGSYPCSDSLTLQSAISYAHDQGVTVVVAAGNSNTDASGFSPASCSNVITVGATGHTDARSSYSNYGFTVDIAAPGGDILKCGSSDDPSCLINSTYLNNQYKLFQGTSMATPHVVGVVALLLSKNPSLNPDKIETILKNNGDVISTDKPIGKRLNANKALQVAAGITPTPTPSISSPTPTSSLPTPTPTILPTSNSYNRVFVTSKNYGGNLGGVTGADAKCQERANAVTLGGNWKAWISDSSASNSANSRLYHSEFPYKLLNGTVIANNWTDLTDESILNPLNISELMTKVNVGGWTHTIGNGNSNAATTLHCNDWTNGTISQMGDKGSATYTSSLWTLGGAANCAFGAAPLFCFEQPAAVPSVSPSPTPTDWCTVCVADVNKDGVVDGQDFSLARACFGKPAAGSCAASDLDKSGNVTISDINCVTRFFGKLCPK